MTAFELEHRSNVMASVPNSAAETLGRVTEVDTIRAAALVGICVVNLPFMGLPLEDVLRAPVPALDRAAALLVGTLFASKFFLLFSFLFGWGLSIQMASAARAGAHLGPRYARRIVALGVLGCLHAVLVFTGDILVLYALLGALLWPLRSASVRALVRVTAAMVPVAIGALIVLGVLIGKPESLAAPDALGGSFLEATRARLIEWPGTFVVLVLFQGPMAFGAMTAGLAAAKAGFFEPGSVGRARLARAVPWCAAVGVAANLGIALAPIDPENLLAFLVVLSTPVAAPLLSAAWLHLFLWADERLPIPSLVVLAGRNSLTVYVTQGVIAGAVFGGYGLGLFGTLGQALLLPLSLGVAVLAMLLTAAVARIWKRAPLEHLLRVFTRGLTR